ncbi:MAG: heme lyase CcmF/NrfE family subunit [Gemmatimonadetes bacterium]|nr:heme lyase CcmF/NrfE family subunit [Gemmatimonadota bacterium]
MTRIIGFAACGVALCVAIWGAFAAVLGARRRNRALVESAQVSAYAAFGLITLANLAMLWALITHDFSVAYVAQVGSRATPLWVTIVSLWSSLEGSILFWGWVLSGYTAAAVYTTRRGHGALAAYANATLLAIAVFFYLLLIGPANPWTLVSPAPMDGPGPNPLLQNHVLMAVHPPLLYLGYVGMSVPFAFAIGSLLSGRADSVWLRLTRRWTLVSWIFLSLAIVAGMWWSYDVLGWGGYWAWDPVENASFMPWLTATAFLHSAMVQERRDMLRVWNLSLIISTFLLTILGTFLTRSGVLSSVHAFSEGPIGRFFLSFIGIVLVLSLFLLSGRAATLRSPGSMSRPVSREGVFLVNNLLFTTFTFTVLLGTLFPLVAEIVRGVQVSVGAPFFNRMTVPIVVALLFLVGVGPVLPWGGGGDRIRRRLRAPAVAGALVLVILLATGTRSFWAITAFSFAAFTLVSNLQEFVIGAATRMRSHGEAAWTALYRLVAANHRRYGGYLAHLGVVALAVGITASSAFRTERAVTLDRGQSVIIEGYRVQFDRMRAWEEPHRLVVAAELTAFEGDREIGSMEPRINLYTARQEPITTPAVRSGPRRDLYVNLLAYDDTGANATLSVIVEPMVWWIWVGGFIVGAGGLLSAWPVRRRRTIARRGAGERVEVG